MEATNGPAVQSLTWISPHHGSIFCWEKNRNRAAADFKILGNGKWKSQAHIAALYPRNSNQVTVISIDHLPRFTPPFMRCREGVRVAFYRCAFCVFLIGRFVSSWARDSNRPAANAPVELIILRLRVWRFSATRP